MTKRWSFWGFITVGVFLFAGCGALNGISLSDKAITAEEADNSALAVRTAEKNPAPPAEKEGPAAPETTAAVKRQSEPKVDIYQQAVKTAGQIYEEGLQALADNNPALARKKFQASLAEVRVAQEKYPNEKEQLEKYYLTLKQDIEEAQKDKLSFAEDKGPKGETGASPPSEPVLMVKPEELEKLGEGAPPLDKPRRVDSDLPVVFNEPVERFIRAYQTVRKGKFYEGMSRMGRYQPYVQKVFKEKGIPQDLIYLGLIESAFNPHVMSRARALGIWQFIPGTGRVYRLRQDFWIDERKDFEKSTEAAANYLKTLYDRFGDWSLALAGYNAGEGRVEWALRRSKARDYWQLRLPRETKLFVPAIYATVVIAKNLEEYGFSDLRPDLPFEYEKVSIPDATDLKIIADCAGVEAQLIHDMNPELLRWCTPPKTDYEVKIPRGTKEKFLEKFAQIPKEQWVSWRTHKVQTGETLAKIGQRYRMTAAALAEMNHLKSIHRIRAGQMLMIPVPWGAPLPHQSPPPPAAANPTNPLPQEVKKQTETPTAPEPVKTEAKAPVTSQQVKPD